MKKFLYITDTHLTAKNPSSRLDNYEIISLRKLLEISYIIKANNIDFVIHGGDMFHSPKVSLRYSGMVAEILKSWGVPIYVVPGNHDMFGYNLKTIDQTILGLFEKTKVLNTLTRNNRIFIPVGNLKACFEAQEYYMDIDKGNVTDFEIKDKTSDYNILITHSMLLPQKFFDGVPHTLIKDVVTDADLVLAGHYHNGFKEQEHNNTWFFNPGATIRVESNRIDKPKILMFKLSEDNGKIKMQHKYIELISGKPREEIFDITKKQEKKQAAQVVESFKNDLSSLQSLQLSSTLEDLIVDISKELSSEPEVLSLSLKFIGDSESETEDNSASVKGFIEKKYKLGFKKITIKNFQSHEKTIIKFKDGLNTITGESNSGKTSILRAMLWCLYNEPKGNEFIRTGEKECSVEIEFTDNSKILRKRTLTSSGVYEVTNCNGETNIYKGFGSEIPIEVINEHQMPIVPLSKDLKSKLNVSSQLEQPFLLCESPSARANAIGRLTGVQVIDNAIKNCNKEILLKSKEIKILDENIKSYNMDLNQDKYKNLIDLNKYIEKIEKLIKVIDLKSSELKDLKEYNSKLNHFKSLELKIQKNLLNLECIPLLSEVISKSNNLSNSVKELVGFNSTLHSLKDRQDKHFHSLEYINTILNNSIYVESSFKLLNQIEDVFEYNSRLKDNKKNLDKLNKEIAKFKNISYLGESVKTLSDKIQSLKEYIEIKQKNIKAIKLEKENKNVLNSIDSKINKTITEKELVLSNLDKYIKENKICPVCNSKINISNLLEAEGEYYGK